MAVVHHEAEQRFVLALPEGDAVLDYVVEAEAGPMNILSTVVPTAGRGRGSGGKLVRAALDHARAQGWPVIPSCWFVGTWVDEHPDYRGLLIGS